MRHAATGHTHVTEQQLDHRHSRMFCAPTVCCVQPSAYRKVVCDPVRWWRPALHTLSGSRLLRTADVFYYVRRVAGNVRFQRFHTQRG